MAQSADRTIPVTVASGYLGAGKTTLVNHVLHNPQGLDIAVIVNDMGEVNIDADLLGRDADEEGIIDLSNGCICCELQDDLLTEAGRLAENREFDYLVVEASGISEPIPVAQTFTVGTDDSDPDERFELDTVVSVVDAHRFVTEFEGGESLIEGTEDGPEDPERPLEDVLIDQIEFCDVLLLNKVDLVSEEDVDRIEEVIRTLQPRAEIVRTTHSEIDPARVLDTGRFDLQQAQRDVGWKRELAGHDHESAAEAVGVDSFVYRADEPFHPERFDEAFAELTDVIRAKGIFWLAGREDVMGFNQAGESIRAGPIGEWGSEDEKRTELVFIGTEMDEAAIRDTLNDCLVSDADDAPLTDPFPTR